MVMVGGVRGGADSGEVRLEKELTSGKLKWDASSPVSRNFRLAALWRLGADIKRSLIFTNQSSRIFCYWTS